MRMLVCFRYLRCVYENHFVYTLVEVNSHRLSSSFVCVCGCDKSLEFTSVRLSSTKGTCVGWHACVRIEFTIKIV